MKNLHLTIMLFCHVLLASVVFYFAASLAAASPLVVAPLPEPTKEQVSVQEKQQVVVAGAQAAPFVVPAVPVAAKAPTLQAGAQPATQFLEQKAAKADSSSSFKVIPSAVEQQASRAPKADELDGKKDAKQADKEQELKQTVVAAPIVPLETASAVFSEQQKTELIVEPKVAPVVKSTGSKFEPAFQQVAFVPESASLIAPPEAHRGAQTTDQIEPRSQPIVEAKQQKVAEQKVVPTAQQADSKSPKEQQVVARASEVVSNKADEPKAAAELVVQAKRPSVLQAKMASPTTTVEQIVEQPIVKATVKPAPVVNGGLGPLHLLATTLCSYQPDRQLADDAVNQLYARRAIVRKSLFDFMSLKFTNLEKLSSRLGIGLLVVPVKSVPEPKDGQAASGKPSHGWPLVGKCTAHDLKLMGEAAWCECNENDCSSQQQAAASNSGQKQQQQQPVQEQASNKQLDNKQAALDSKQKTARSIETVDSFSPEQSSVISKILQVSETKEAPVMESAFYNLNLTQHQLATLEAQATTTQECRRNALRYSKALFQHLAEDQQSRSDSWPKLYAQISADECARKRMIDIVNALSSFRTDTTSIRRDNVEFAFAMDDLRTKVLENEINIPLTFDRHFIEVEQFLQQSVRLMLASVQPKRAKLTTMRYRSLMYGASPSSDDQQQCIDLHQRLLAKNYPSDCNPTQFGQLPDVLRMTANSLELWSIEKELSLHLAKVADYPNITPVGQQKVREDVNECIAKLVAS